MRVAPPASAFLSVDDVMLFFIPISFVVGSLLTFAFLKKSKKIESHQE